MEKLKLILFSIVVLMLVGLLGYWAIFTIEPGDAHADMQRQKELIEKNTELEKEVKKLKDEIASLQVKEEEQAPKEQPKAEPAAATTANLSKYQSLINDLQKLIDAKVFLKEKSQGSRVATIQTFLNLYNNTSKKVDNDYGPGVKTDVIKFQQAEGLSPDGEAGPSTFLKMIEWLKKQ